MTDPNGMILEFTLDALGADAINQVRRGKAHEELRQWLNGDHTTNDIYRADH